jgi:hypothetical protein
MGMQCRKPGEQEKVKCFKKTLLHWTQDPACLGSTRLWGVNFGTNAEKASGPPRYSWGTYVYWLVRSVETRHSNRGLFQWQR